MYSKEHIEKMTDDALNSFDSADRARPKPFLLTRINARLNKEKNTIWETAIRFIARPAVVITGLCLIIGFNAFVVIYNYSATATTVTEQLITTDEFSASFATLDDLENIELK